jgi:hypothetical protein
VELAGGFDAGRNVAHDDSLEIDFSARAAVGCNGKYDRLIDQSRH